MKIKIVWRANNKAFDREVVLDDINGFNIGFPGQYYDEETGLNYNWHRYCDPELSRYISRDPIGLDGGMNTYHYASANPLIRTDFYGLKDCEEIDDDGKKEACVQNCLERNYGDAYQTASSLSYLSQAALLASGTSEIYNRITDKVAIQTINREMGGANDL